MSVRALTKLEEKLPSGVEAVAAGGAVEALRRVKDAQELAAIAEAAKLADAALKATVEEGFIGKTERAVADAFEAHVRAGGGTLSFDTIVASGPNGAQPHAEPGDRVIPKGELVTFDNGAKLDGYCSDGTRTYATGDPGEEGHARLRDRARRPGSLAGGDPPGDQGRGRRRGGPQGDRRRRPRRPLRPRPRPRRRPRHPRGPAPVPALRRHPGDERSRHRRARDLPGRRPRRADRGPGRRHRRRLPQPLVAARKS